MRIVVRNCMVYLMTSILFVASTGFTLFSHTCFILGETQVSTQKIDSCCDYEATSTNTVISDPCCDDKSQFLKFEVAGARLYNHEFYFTSFNLLFIIEEKVSFSANTTTLGYNNLPPPKTGREILIEYQIFLI